MMMIRLVTIITNNGAPTPAPIGMPMSGVCSLILGIVMTLQTLFVSMQLEQF